MGSCVTPSLHPVKTGTWSNPPDHQRSPGYAMKIIVAPNREKACRYAASVVVSKFMEPYPVRLGLATGHTMIPVYASVVQQLMETPNRPVAHVPTFNLDEYWPITPDHPGSFQYFMQAHLFSKVPGFLRQVNFLQGDVPDPEIECERFDYLLCQTPIDLQIVGLGVNGHIGFNEPGTPFASRTRKVRLAPATMERNGRDFPGVMPAEALTVGIANIMAAKAVLLVAFGIEKRNILSRALRGPVIESCPASILQWHPDVTIITDKNTARPLAMHCRQCADE